MGICSCCKPTEEVKVELTDEKTAIRDRKRALCTDNEDKDITITLTDSRLLIFNLIQAQAAFKAYLVRRTPLPCPTQPTGSSSTLLSPATQQSLQQQGKYPFKAPYAPGSQIALPDNSIYTGECNSLKQPEGQGTLYYSDGGIYEGDWKQGVPCGQGRIITSIGDTYIGSWA